jgi:hypothetical protein
MSLKTNYVSNNKAYELTAGLAIETDSVEKSVHFLGVGRAKSLGLWGKWVQICFNSWLKIIII